MTYNQAVNMKRVLTADNVNHKGRGDMLVQLVHTFSESIVAWCALARNVCQLGIKPGGWHVLNCIGQILFQSLA